MQKALTKAVTTPASRNDQRHGCCGNRPIAMTDQSLNHSRLATADARLGARRNPLFVGAPQQQPNQTRVGRASRPTTSASISARLPSSLAGDRQARQSARISSAMSPMRQCSIAVISARSCSVRRSAGVEEEIDPDGGQPIATRARARLRSGRLPMQRSAIPPASSRDGVIRFALTSRQLGFVNAERAE